jgi:hypothetical protein
MLRFFIGLRLSFERDLRFLYHFWRDNDKVQIKMELNENHSAPQTVMVPGAGIEPAWSKPRWILSPVRLPVSPPRLKAKA